MIIQEYDEVGWIDEPDTSTAVSASNLSRMDNGIKYNRNALKKINDAINQVDLEMFEEIKHRHTETIENADDAINAMEIAVRAAENAEAISGVGIASQIKAGIVKPDSTLSIDSQGVVGVRRTTSKVTYSYNYGYAKMPIDNVASDSYAFVDASFMQHILGQMISSLVTMIRDVYYSISSQINTMKMNYLGNTKLIKRGVLDGRLVANGEYFDLEPGAMYLLFANTILNTNGAYRGMQAYAIGSAWGYGTSTTAQSIARVFALGAHGTVGVNVTATYNTPEAGVASYVSRIGIGSCTTACRVRYSLYKVMGSLEDFI